MSTRNESSVTERNLPRRGTKFESRPLGLGGARTHDPRDHVSTERA